MHGASMISEKHRLLSGFLLLFYERGKSANRTTSIDIHQCRKKTLGAARWSLCVELSCAPRSQQGARGKFASHIVCHVHKSCKRHLKKKFKAACLSLANPGFFKRYPLYTIAVRTGGVLRTKGPAYILRTRWSCLDSPFTSSNYES